jgi:hypothetical protein
MLSLANYRKPSRLNERAEKGRSFREIFGAVLVFEARGILND